MTDNQPEKLELQKSRGFNHLFIGPMHDPDLCPECIRPHSLDKAVITPPEEPHPSADKDGII